MNEGFRELLVVMHRGGSARGGAELTPKRVPLVRVPDRWLGAFGFKEGARFAAIGVEEAYSF